MNPISLAFSRMTATWLALGAATCLAGADLSAPATPRLRLLPVAAVDSQGVFLHQLVAGAEENAALHLRFTNAPAFGQALMLSRAEVLMALRESMPDLTPKSLTGADRVRIVRRTRLFKGSDVVEMLLPLMQNTYVGDRGELELRLTRTWQPIAVPDEPLEMKILDAPVSGVSPNFIVRFELKAGGESAGRWQASAQAKIWREIWVTAAPLRRGQLLGSSDLVRERRDVISLRDLFTELPGPECPIELLDNLPSGVPIYSRVVRPRPIVHRGDLLQAVLDEGTLSVSLKVEALEDGAFGQAIRVRNPQTRRELRGKVQNERSVIVFL